MSDEQPKYKWPTSLGGKVDRLQKLDEDRDALMAKVKVVETEYKALEEHLIETIPKNDLQGASGKLAAVKLDRKPVPTATDWDKVYAYIKKTGYFNLLKKQLVSKACNELWEAKKVIPGVEVYTVIKLKLSKLKG
jgi:hypothetical protein